jgi:2-polyprenyl-3-methyl-5-hydroxy-6-metoxy-1,4-benzoquinol methylase
MNNQENYLECLFCKSATTPVYKMKDYIVYRCSSCGTGQVAEMPTSAELRNFYKGFLFSANMANLEKIMQSGPNLFSKLNLWKNGRLKMLDVGGGGGFYAKAFEATGYGQSTYVDLDSDACHFAREKVGLTNVLNQDAAMLETEGVKYDFIMCRHLIEHMIEPTQFILKLTGLLSAAGTLLIVCPNGDSLEYFAYPQILKKRVEKICSASHISKFKVVTKLLFGEMLHGIDPPRHLWAVSRKGMMRFLTENNIHADIATFPLTDSIYSPYYSSRTLSQKIWSIFGDMVASKFTGGTHLSVVIRKPLKPENKNVI